MHPCGIDSQPEKPTTSIHVELADNRRNPLHVSMWDRWSIRGAHLVQEQSLKRGLLDKVSIPKIHNSVRLLSLEQRRQKQLLIVMIIHTKKGKSRSVTNINTRSQTKNVFKTETKITAPNHQLCERQDRCSIFTVLCYFRYFVRE